MIKKSSASDRARGGQVSIRPVKLSSGSCHRIRIRSRIKEDQLKSDNSIKPCCLRYIGEFKNKRRRIVTDIYLGADTLSALRLLLNWLHRKGEID